MEQIGITFPLEKKSNTVDRGTRGLAKAISFFCSKNCIAALPITDNQPYDLLVDDGKKIHRIQVKTSTSFSNSGYNRVTLQKTRHNKKVNKVTPIKKEDCDFLFIYTSSDKMYLIPIDVVDRMYQATLGDKYDKYLVSENVLEV